MSKRKITKSMKVPRTAERHKTISQKHVRELIDHTLDRPDNYAVIHQYVIQLLAQRGVHAAIGSISKDGIKLGSSRPMIPFAPAKERGSASFRLKTLNFFNMGSRTLTYPNNTHRLTTYKKDYPYTAPTEFGNGIPFAVRNNVSARCDKSVTHIVCPVRFNSAIHSWDVLNTCIVNHFCAILAYATC